MQVPPRPFNRRRVLRQAAFRYIALAPIENAKCRRFHEVEPQADLEPLPQAELSKMVVTRAKRTVPYPILGENTLVRGPGCTSRSRVWLSLVVSTDCCRNRSSTAGAFHAHRTCCGQSSELSTSNMCPALRTAHPCSTLTVTSCQWICRLEPRRAQVLSDSMVLTEDDGGLCLMARVGDTFPNQILDPIVRAYLYRWPGSVHNPGPDYTVRTP